MEIPGQSTPKLVETEMNDRLKAELAYQAERASTIKDLTPTPNHVIEKYRRCRLWRLFPAEFILKHLADISDKEILDFGCGDGALSTIIAALGGRVTAVDVSPDLVKVAERRADLDGVRDRIQFLVRDITESALPEEKFDIVVCNLVLHHTDIQSVYPLLLASLKLRGTAVILEPIAFSPTLQTVRNRVPIVK